MYIAIAFKWHHLYFYHSRNNNIIVRIVIQQGCFIPATLDIFKISLINASLSKVAFFHYTYTAYIYCCCCASLAYIVITGQTNSYLQNKVRVTFFVNLGAIINLIAPFMYAPSFDASHITPIVGCLRAANHARNEK